MYNLRTLNAACWQGRVVQTAEDAYLSC